MKVYGFVDRGIPKVKMYWGNHLALIMTLRQFASMKNENGSSLGQEMNHFQEMNHLLNKVTFASRITHVITGGKA